MNTKDHQLVQCFFESCLHSDSDVAQFFEFFKAYNVEDGTLHFPIYIFRVLYDAA